jgi:hypothetical protein
LKKRRIYKEGYTFTALILKPLAYERVGMSIDAKFFGLGLVIFRPEPILQNKVVVHLHQRITQM